jgi:hypothetical protein
MERLEQLQAIGVDPFNIYLMTRGQDETFAVYGEQISPRFTGGGH